MQENNTLPAEEKKTILKIEVVCFIFGFSGILSSFEIPNMVNNLHGNRLFILFFVIGLLMAFFTRNIMRKLLPVINRAEKRTNALINGALFAGFVLLMPALANYYNRTFPLSDQRCADYIITKKAETLRGGHSYYFMVQVEDCMERLETDQATWENTTEGKPINLCITRGGLGFDFVEDINHVTE